MQEDASLWFGEELDQGGLRQESLLQMQHRLPRGMEPGLPAASGAPRREGEPALRHSGVQVPHGLGCAPAEPLCWVQITVASLGAIGFCRGDAGETEMWGSTALPGSLCLRTPPAVLCAEFTVSSSGGGPAAQGTGVCPSVGNQSCALNVTLCIVWRMVERRSVIELLQWWIHLLEKS